MKSAARALAVLELLDAEPGGLEAGTIARRTGIPRSSTYALLGLLRERGFLVSDDGRRWKLGHRLDALGSESPSIEEVVTVLEAFRESGGAPVDLTSLVTRTRRHVSTVRHVLAVLAAASLVVEDGDGRFALGLRLAALTAGLGALDELRAIVAPVLEELRDRTGETSNLVVLDADHVIYLDQAESRRALRHAGWIGRRIPTSSSASGQAITGSGFAVVRDAVEEGVTAVARRIELGGDPKAALSVTGPGTRLDGERLDDAAAALADACRRVERRLRALT